MSRMGHVSVFHLRSQQSLVVSRRTNDQNNDGTGATANDAWLNRLRGRGALSLGILSMTRGANST